jgi:CheY-like chemotaxis protein
VDDDPKVLSSLRRALAREPMEILTTDSSEQALEWLGRREIRLVVSDLRMPGMNGADLLETVHRRYPSVSRMMLTAYPSSARILRSMKEGVQELITKPWDDRDLKAAIRGLLDSPLPEAPDARLVIPIDCRGMTPDEALLAVDDGLRSMGKMRWSCDIHLENLPLLQGSASRLLIGMGRLLADLGVRASVDEATGLARAFLDAVGGMSPRGLA